MSKIKVSRIEKIIICLKLLEEEGNCIKTYNYYYKKYGLYSFCSQLCPLHVDKAPCLLNFTERANNYLKKFKAEEIFEAKLMRLL